ncbi:MAG: hypothetical protein V4523_14385 [Pseudomonadota bacterium]
MFLTQTTAVIQDDSLPVYSLDAKLAAVLDLGPSLLFRASTRLVKGGALGEPAAGFGCINLADESELVPGGARHPTLTNTGATGSGKALGFGWRGDLNFSPNNGWLQLSDDREHPISGDYSMAFCIFVPTEGQTAGNRGGIVFGARDDSDPSYFGVDYNEGDPRISHNGTGVEAPGAVGTFITALTSYSLANQRVKLFYNEQPPISAVGMPPWGADRRLIIGATGATTASNYYLVGDVACGMVLGGKALGEADNEVELAAVRAWLAQERAAALT